MAAAGISSDSDLLAKASSAAFTAFADLQDQPAMKAKLADKSFLTGGIEAALADEDWTVGFRALEDLRTVNKFHTDALAASLEFLAPLVKAAVDNLRSNIAKNALALCKEVFLNKSLTVGHRAPTIVFMEATLPSLLSRT